MRFGGREKVRAERRVEAAMLLRRLTSRGGWLDGGGELGVAPAELVGWRVQCSALRRQHSGGGFSGADGGDVARRRVQG